MDPSSPKLGNARKKLHKTTLISPPLYRHVLLQSLAVGSPAIFVPQNFCLNLHEEEECWLFKAAPQQCGLSCFALQPSAEFTGTKIRGQMPKAPSGVSGETLALRQGFSGQCKIWVLLSGRVSFSPFYSREPKVNKCLYHALEASIYLGEIKLLCRPCLQHLVLLLFSKQRLISLCNLPRYMLLQCLNASQIITFFFKIL